MPSVDPQSVVNEWWEDIGRLGRDDHDVLFKLNQKLWALSARCPREPRVHLTAAYGLLRAGLRSQADQHIESAYDQRFSIPSDWLVDLTYLLACVGDVKRSKRILSDLLSQDGAGVSRPLMHAAYGIACLDGDMDLLSEVSRSEANEAKRAEGILGHLREAGIGDYFSRHQFIVQERLRNNITGFSVFHSSLDASDDVLAIQYFSNLDRSDRFQAKMDIEERLEELYYDHPDGVGVYIGVLQSIVSGPEIVDCQVSE